MKAATEAQALALRAALRRVGAPLAVAAQLASSATVEANDNRTMLCLHGHCVDFDDEDELTPVDHLAENAAADNAEAFDRHTRGEPGYSPWWDLPEREQRLLGAAPGDRQPALASAREARSRRRGL